jgi:hypothetical protein
MTDWAGAIKHNISEAKGWGIIVDFPFGFMPTTSVGLFS